MSTAVPDMKMPSSDQRARLMVPDSAKILKRFYFLQQEMILMQAGWLPGTEHWQSKLLLPEFLWQDSVIARELRQRVLELRFPERNVAPGDDEALLKLFRQFRDAPDGFAFVEGLRRVVKPLLKEAFSTYLDMADTLDDGPTIRILRQAIGDVDEQVARFEEAAADAQKAYPQQIAAAQTWVRGIEGVAQQLREILVTEPLAKSLPEFSPERFGGKTFAIARRGVRDKRFNVVLFGWPDSLTPERGPGTGFELQIRQAAHHLNEIWAAEMAAACIFDLTEGADPEFLIDAARWCYDEIRHCRMGFTRFLKWGFQMHEMPMGSFSYDAGAELDPLTRLGIIFYFESTYIHTKWQRQRYFAEFGDRVSSHDMDFDWADEQIHAHYGTRWLKYFLDKQGDTRKPIDFREQAEAAIKKMRTDATPAQHTETQQAFEKTMSRARELAGAK